MSKYGKTKPLPGAQVNWAHPLSQDLIGCWNFNEGSGRHLYDATGRYGHGVVAGTSSVPAWETGAHGRQLRFTHTDNQRVQVANNVAYVLTSEANGGLDHRRNHFSYQCKFYLNTLRNYNGLMSKTVSFAHRPFDSLVLGDGTLYCQYGSQDVASITTVAAGRWYDMVVVQDWAVSPRNTVYLDTGLKVVKLTSADWVSADGTIRFGNRMDDITPLDGCILYGRLWHRSLTESEVSTLFSNPYCFMADPSPARFFGGANIPAPITALVKAKGKGIPPMRIPSSGSTTMAALSQAVFAVSADFDGTAELFSGAGVSQGAMTQDARANNSGKVQSLIFSKYIPSAGSYYAIFTMGAAGNAAGALLEVANVAAASQIDQTATATGSSTSPSSGATSATTQAYEVVIGAIGTEGPGGDTQGSWSNGFQPIAYTGTTGGAAAANVSLSVGYKIVNATGAQTAAKTGITSRQWGAAVATYKGLVASAPAADPVTYLTTSPLTAGTVGDMYSEYFEVYGGVAPYTYAVQSGSLPGGLSLATDGGLSGTPTMAGVYTFTIRATDSAAETEDLVCSLTITAAAAGRRKPKTHILTMPGRFF